jgi:hypothetical protein
MKLSDIILNEEKGVSRRILIKLIHDIGPERFADIIADLKDENLQDQIVAKFNMYTKDGTEWIRPDILREDSHGDGYEEGNIKLMGDMILPIDKEMVLQAQDDKYNRGLLVTSKEDRSYDVAYWADKFEPYPIEVEIDGKSVSKDAKNIKLLFHPEMK